MNELENIVNNEKPNVYDFVYIYSRCVFNLIFQLKSYCSSGECDINYIKRIFSMHINLFMNDNIAIYEKNLIAIYLCHLLDDKYKYTVLILLFQCYFDWKKLSNLIFSCKKEASISSIASVVSGKYENTLKCLMLKVYLK